PVANTMKRKSFRSRVADRMYAVLDFIGRNTLAVGLATMVVVLLLLFFVGLSVLAPNSQGQQVEWSRAWSLVNTNGALHHATLQDQDARLQLVTSSGKQLWTAYPHADPYTANLLTALEKHNVPTTVDPQSGKATLRLVVQFLLPILI